MSAPRLGAWVRTGGMVGLVAAVEDGTVAVFDPGERQLARVPAEQVQVLPAGAVTLAVAVDLPVPHGVSEEVLRRWAASLLDEDLRARAREALEEAGLDPGAALPPVRVTVTADRSGGAVCLCGARTPAADGESPACASCGRQAATPPPLAGL